MQWKKCAFYFQFRFLPPQSSLQRISVDFMKKKRQNIKKDKILRGISWNVGNFVILALASFLLPLFDNVKYVENGFDLQNASKTHMDFFIVRKWQVSLNISLSANQLLQSEFGQRFVFSPDTDKFLSWKRFIQVHTQFDQNSDPNNLSTSMLRQSDFYSWYQVNFQTHFDFGIKYIFNKQWRHFQLNNLNYFLTSNSKYFRGLIPRILNKFVIFSRLFLWRRKF